MNNSKYEIARVTICGIEDAAGNKLAVFDPPIKIEKDGITYESVNASLICSPLITRRRTTFAVQSTTNPEIGFAVTVSLENYDKAKELVKEGFDAWCCCSCRETTTHFSEEDYDWIESSGYAEPAEYLLEKFGIEYTIESCFGDDGDWLPDFDIGKIWEVI